MSTDKIAELIRKHKVKVVMAESHDRTPDSEVKARINANNNGLVILDYMNLIKSNKS